jgi:hypothetical protein
LRSQNFGIYQQEQLKLNLFCSAARAAKDFGICQQEQFTQIDCISFCRAEKFFGIATKSSVFCSAAQRNFLELRTKVEHFVLPCSENFWDLLTKTTQNCCVAAFCSTVQPNFRNALYFVQSRRERFWHCEQKALQCVQPRSEKFGIYQQKQLELTVFCSAAQ